MIVYQIWWKGNFLIGKINYSNSYEIINFIVNFEFRLGSDPSRLFPFEALKNQFKTHGIYAAIVGSITISIQTADENTVPDLQDMPKELEFNEKNIFLPKDDSFDKRTLELIADLAEFGFI